MKFQIINIFICILLINGFNSLFAYFKYEISCANDYVDYVISSEGIIPPINPNPISHKYRDYYYTYKFSYIIHDTEKPICIQLVNLRGKGGFAFTHASINEYNIKTINYEDFYYCNNCNATGPQTFQITSEKCGNDNVIKTCSNSESFYYTVNNTFCFNSSNNISLFYFDEDKINQNFYKGKKIEFIINNEIDNFNIDNVFFINDNQSLTFYFDTVSFKIVDIINKKGNIFLENEELFINSFFNAENKTFTFKKNNEEGYLMIIKIETKPRDRNISISTCQEEGQIYLYVYQKNCSINETSNNFCQQCISEYGKYEDENKCYHKSEQFDNLYYDDQTQLWKNCDINYNNFICSICPKGTFIKEIFTSSSSKICEKCKIGEFNSIKNSNQCKKCQKGYFSNKIGEENCQKCPDGYTSFPGASYCYKECEGGYYPNGDICAPCQPDYYSERSSINCQKCEDNKYSLLGFSKCVSCQEIIPHCNICSKDIICLECNNKALNLYNNCTICENNIDWKYNGDSCQLLTYCPKYFYKDKYNKKINCVEDIMECPQGMDYLNLNTSECKENANPEDFINYQYKIKGGEDELNKIADIIFKTYQDIPEFLDDILSKKKIKIKGINSTLQIGYADFLKANDIKDVSIDFGDCPQRITFNITSVDNKEFKPTIKVVDLVVNNTRLIHYDFYDSKDFMKPLDITPCKNEIITIVSPNLNNSLLDYLKNFKQYPIIMQLIKDGSTTYDIYSHLYNDSCFSLSELDKYDLTLNERRDYLLYKTINLCEDGCQYGGENLETAQVICECQINDINETNKNELFIKGLKDIKYRQNFIVLKCFKLLFSKFGLGKNYFFFFNYQYYSYNNYRNIFNRKFK